MNCENEFWKDKKVFVTGATGFIGSQLIKKLSLFGADITAFLHGDEGSLRNTKNIKIIKGDITEEILNLDCFDYIFHTAAIVGNTKCSRKKEAAFLVNVKGTENLLKRAPDKIKKFVYLSTSYIYGNKPNAHEEDIPSPLDLYSETKFLGEEEVRSYSKAHNIPISIIRISNTYGPGQKSGIVPLFIQKIKENQELVVSDSTRDFIYIDDVISGILFIASKGEGIYNLGSGKEETIKGLAEILMKKLNKISNIKIDDNDEIKRNYLNITKIKKLGWTLEYTLEKGLNKILES